MERTHGEEAGYNDQILIVCVQGAKELPALLAADHRLSEVQDGPERLEVVASFCYLGDMLSAGGGFELTVATRVKTPWKKIREPLPVLTSRPSLTRPVTMCTALAYGAPCSMSVKFGHRLRPTCSTKTGP